MLTGYSGAEAKYGDKVLELMGYRRGADNGEPYILVVGVGHDEAPGLSDIDRTTIYYVGYIEDLSSPSLFYVNGEWTTKWPRDEGALASGDRLVNNGNGYARNTLVTSDNRSIPLRFYIISNRSGNDNIWLDSQWSPTHSTLQGNSEDYRLG